MSAGRAGPGHGERRKTRPRGGPARRSTRPPQGGALGGALRGAIEGELSRPVSMLPGKADDGAPEPGTLRPLARALIELAVALRRDEDEKGARQ